MMMVPEAFGPHYHMSEDKRAFYEYHAAIMEPWDGPAAISFSDGIKVGSILDRNGLRPARWVVTRSGLVVLASEVGVLDIPPEDILQKGRLAPGKMFLVDTAQKRIIYDNEVKAAVSRRKPYRRWVEANRIELKGLFQVSGPVRTDRDVAPGEALGLRLHHGRHRHGDHAHGGELPGAHQLHGKRREPRRALRSAAAAVQLFQAALRPGDQPSHRSVPREPRHVADELRGPGEEPPRRDPRARAAGEAARIPSSPTTISPSCAPSTSAATAPA